MAWRCGSSTNAGLINNLFENGIIASERVRTAMLSVDRANYTSSLPYEDSPQSIGHSATISAPHMHAHALESLLLFLKPGSRVLDIGSGSGYLTHCLAKLVEPGGKVVGIEHIQALVDLSRENTRKSESGRRLMESGVLALEKGDGRLGKVEEEGWDAIHVGAAAQAEVIKGLVEQLRATGRIFMPVADSLYDQNIYVIDKKEDGSVTKKKSVGVRYVPLTDAPKD